MSVSQKIASKIEHIKNDLCVPWSEKISRALYAKKDGLTTPRGTPRGTANTEQQKEPAAPTAPTPEQQQPVVEEKPSEQQKPEENAVEQNTTAKQESQENSEDQPKTEKQEAPKEKRVNINVDDEIVERTITVEFDWPSFNDLFSSLINEGAADVIDTIMDSLVSKDCAVSLLSSLLEHCKHLQGDNSSAQTKVSKHEQIRAFLQQNLKKYIIKYSDDPREWGYFKDGVLCDVVEIDVTDDEEINWIFRDVTQNIENCTDLQQYIVTKYMIPFFRRKISDIMYKDIVLDVDWTSIDYAAQDYAKAVYTIYHESSAFVLDEIFRAFEWLATYESDELVDAIAFGINKVNVALQPGQDSTRKDFDVDDNKKCLTLRLCLEADEFAGVFRHRDLVPIIKIAGLYNTDYSKVFKYDLLSAAASIYKVPRGDLSTFVAILNRPEFFHKPSAQDNIAIEGCKKFIDRYYKEKIQSNADPDRKRDDGDGEDDGEDDDEEFEKIIKGWHVIKFNKMNLHQERFLILTNKAYWTFKFDFQSNKIDEKHYKRHDLLDFCVVDIGVLEQTDKIDIHALKIFTREKRKPDIFGNPYQEVVAVQQKEGKNKKTKVSIELRKSLKLKQTTSGEMDIFKQLNLGALNLEQARMPRNKKPKPVPERPSVANCYNSVFLPYGELDVQQIKEILTEISWCVYAAAVARQRTRSAEPFMNQVLTRPKETFASFVYNVLGLGIVGKMKKNPGQSQFSLKKALKNAFAGNSKDVDNDGKDSPKVKDFHTYEYNKMAKPVKPILKKPGGEKPKQAVTVQPPQENTSEQNSQQQSPEERRVVFRPEVQVFYTDDNEEDD
jgi:hypothetical protein